MVLRSRQCQKMYLESWKSLLHERAKNFTNPVLSSPADEQQRCLFVTKYKNYYSFRVLGNDRDKRRSWIQEFVCKIFHGFRKIVAASNRATDRDIGKHAEFYRRTTISSLSDRSRRKVNRSSTSLECQRSSYRMIADVRIRKPHAINDDFHPIAAFVV